MLASAARFHKMQSWSSVVFWLCSVLPPSIRDFKVYGECRTESQMYIFIFIQSCLPKLEKRVLMRNVLREVWDGFFFSGKEESPQLKRGLIHPDFLLQKYGVNVASLLRLLLPAIVFPWIPVWGRAEAQPAFCFSRCTIILARRWPR